MARSPSASPREASPVFDLLPGIHADAANACASLACVLELLRGCDPTHPIAAGGLLALLEPVWGSLDTLCGDLGTAQAQNDLH